MRKDQQGQALPFVIVVMTVALALGVNVSMRTLSSVSRTTRTDTSERVRAAAEAGAERFLVLSVNSLDYLEGKFNAGTVTDTDCKIAGNDFQLVDGLCRIIFPRAVGDEVDVASHVRVESFNGDWTGTTFLYGLTVERDTVAEINVAGLTTAVRLCYSPPSATNLTDIYYIFYGATGLQVKNTLGPSQWGSPYFKSGYTVASTAAPLYGYTYCNNVAVPSGAYGLRIRSIGGDSQVGIAHASLPKQGHRIVSMGELIQEGAVRVTKEVRASKSLPYLPGIFDFGIYSGTGAL